MVGMIYVVGLIVALLGGSAWAVYLCLEDPDTHMMDRVMSQMTVIFCSLLWPLVATGFLLWGAGHVILNLIADYLRKHSASEPE